MASQPQIGTRIVRFLGSLFWSLNVLLSLYTVLIYYLLYALPIDHWAAGLLMTTVPVAWALVLAFGLGWGLARSGRIWLPLLTLLAGCWLWPRTATWHPAQTVPTNQSSLSVLSYNVSGFNPDDTITLANPSPLTKPMIEWVVSKQADVKCFQEFYTSPSIPKFQIANQLRRAGYKYIAIGSARTVSLPDTDGLVTFSRYPIIRQGGVNFNETNGFLWTDIRLPHDTVRVINVHLRSMGVRVQYLLAEKKLSGVKYQTLSLVDRLRFGFLSHRTEAALLEAQIASSPYPVLLTGDFNETPYSLIYQRLRRRLSNAFEDAGRGFGFSYNHLPYFIRIDNQFYGSRLQVYDFRTFSKQLGSDHYPVWGLYGLRSR